MAQQLLEQPGAEEELNNCWLHECGMKGIYGGEEEMFWVAWEYLCFGRKSNELTANWASKGYTASEVFMTSG